MELFKADMEASKAEASVGKAEETVAKIWLITSAALFLFGVAIAIAIMLHLFRPSSLRLFLR